jgi:hypothetical protein
MKISYFVNFYLFICGYVYKNITLLQLFGISIVSNGYKLFKNINKINLSRIISSPFICLSESNKKNIICKNKNDLKKLSLLSKLIYEYNYVNINNEKENYIINQNINIQSNFTTNFIQNTNIYFNVMQYITFLNKKSYFNAKSDKYFDMLNKKFPDTQIYGYFYNKKRLHALILLNHKYNEIIVVFKGSQYIDEWANNIILYEKKILFDNKFSIHKGIYDMYSNDDIDKNILYILKNLYHYFPNYRKIITGHSKGAINSLLLADELINSIEEKYNYEIFTFGCPPIFNYKFGSYLHNHPQLKIYNVMNKYDIITSFIIPYRYHIGNEIQLDGKNISFIKHDKPYRISFYDTLLHFYTSFINHDMNRYIENIIL